MINLDKKKIADRIINYRRNELKINQQEFGKFFGVSKAAVSKWETQKSIPERDALLELHKKKNINPDWILCRSETKNLNNTISEQQIKDYVNFEHGPKLPIKTTKIPVVGTAQLGPDGFWEAIEYPAGHGDGNVDFYTTDNDAYALRVKGDSMSPAIRSGWLVIVEPSTDYTAESLVVVCTTDGQCMVKEYYAKRDDEYVFLSINPAYSKIIIHQININTIHTVSAIIPPHKYNPF